MPAAAHPGLSSLFHRETTAQRALTSRFAQLCTGRILRRMSDPAAALAVQTRHGPLLGTTVQRFSASQTLDDSLALVVDALEGHRCPMPFWRRA